jgi:hypothetical protein
VKTTFAIRRSICRLLIGVFVSTQLAMTAYACSGMTAQQRQAAVAMTGESDPCNAANPAADMVSGHAALDPAQPNLCAARDQFGQQSSDRPPAPVVHEALPISLYALAPLDDGSEHASRPTEPTTPRAAADPPHAILHCCLRD